MRQQLKNELTSILKQTQSILVRYKDTMSKEEKLSLYVSMRGTKEIISSFEMVTSRMEKKRSD